MRFFILRCGICQLLLLFGLLSTFAYADLSDWELRKGFRLEMDTTGYELPTAIAFVKNPGSKPDDPLYFVTELRGRVKVVTNDRKVYTFAEDFFQLNPLRELPDPAGELGLAGICLDEKNGYVFVSYAYHDELGILRNGLRRFSTSPRVFATKPKAELNLDYLFADHPSYQAHQIGPICIHDGSLIVAIGDARQPTLSRDMSSPCGKILRMSLDGKALGDNPFYKGSGDNMQSYVWAYGFRNPFSLCSAGGAIFVADNGHKVDRFLELKRGMDYAYDGSDASMKLNSAVLFSPSVSPVQMEYFSGQIADYPEEYKNRFYLALSGLPRGAGSTSNGRSIASIDYDFQSKHVKSVPLDFLRYRGKGVQTITALGLGPDGLYFNALYPSANNKSGAIYKVIHDFGSNHPYVFADELTLESVLSSRNCFGCHTQSSNQAAKIGPPLEYSLLQSSITVRLNSSEYMDKLKEFNEDVYLQISKANRTERHKIWLENFLHNTNFDNSGSKMPDFNLNKEEIQLLLTYLLAEPEPLGWRAKIERFLPGVSLRYLSYAFFAGVITTLILILLYRRKVSAK